MKSTTTNPLSIFSSGFFRRTETASILLVALVASFLSVDTSFAAATRVFITSGTSWTVPSDWNSANNTIEVIGGGANASPGNY